MSHKYSFYFSFFLSKGLLLLPYLLKRAFNIIPISVIAIFLTLCLLRLVPGDPVDQILGQYATIEEKTALRQQLGLEKNLYLQTVDYFSGMTKGSLGDSLVYNRPVVELIVERLPATFKLAVFSILLAILLGIPTGALAAFSGEVLGQAIDDTLTCRSSNAKLLAWAYSNSDLFD